MMNSTRLDNQLRRLGYFLVRRNDGEGNYWFVGSQQTHNGFNCTNLAEVSGLVTALSEQQTSGGRIQHDGAGWVCVEAD